MKRYRVTVVVGSSVLMALVWLLSPAAVSMVEGQAPAASTTNVADGDIWANWDPPRTGYEPKRTPDGQPDLQGIYQYPPDPSAVDVEAAPPPSGPGGSRTGDGSPQTGDAPEFWYEGSYDRYGNPVVLNRPYYEKLREELLFQPWAASKREYIQKHENQDRKILDPLARCMRRGVPRIYENAAYTNVQFVQAPNKVTIFYEWNHDSRVIYLDGRPPLPSTIKRWMGDSRGRWEGDTLVVEVTNFNDKTWITGSGPSGGTFHSDEYRLVERYTPMDPDQIYYEAWLWDPQVLSEPARKGFTLTRAWEPGYEQLEYACHEGNKAIENILDGAANLALPPDQRK